MRSLCSRGEAESFFNLFCDLRLGQVRHLYAPFRAIKSLKDLVPRLA